MADTDTLLMVGVKALRDGAEQIRGKGAVALRNGVKATAEQLDAAADIIDGAPKSQITSATGPLTGTVDFDPHDAPGFIHAERQERRALILDVGILPSKTYRITPTGRTREVKRG